jgi:hypothetical protein
LYLQCAARGNPNPNPLVILVVNIKVPTALQAVTNLFISVHVLREEVLHLLFIVFQLIRASLNKVLQNATHIRQRISHTEDYKLEKKCIQKVRANHVIVSSLRISSSSSSLSDFLRIQNANIVHQFLQNKIVRKNKK